MARFTISSLLEGPADLRAQLPITGIVFDARPGPDGMTYFCARLDEPVRYHFGQSGETVPVPELNVELGSSGMYVTIREVVMRSSDPTVQAHEGTQRLAVDLAYAIDGRYMENGQLDFRMIVPVAAAEIDGESLAITSVATAIPRAVIQPAARSTADTYSDPPVLRAHSADRALAPPPSTQWAGGNSAAPDSGGVATHLHEGPGGWSARTTADDEERRIQVRPAPLQEYPQRRGPSKRARMAATAAVLVVVAVIGLSVWAVLRPNGAEGQGSNASTSELPSQGNVAQVEGMLPKGYSSENCAATSDTSRPSLTCGPSAEPGGPQTALYSIEPDQGALNQAFTQTIAAFARVNCPGNIQSPGPWRHSGSDAPAGTLFCGTHDGQDVIVWTDEQRTLLSVVRGAPQGPSLDQLYTWWTNHS
ncbi:hypothetical protein QN239_31120 [Mycolicibacterium sp. Y3]